MNDNKLGVLVTFVVRLDGDPELIKYADQNTFVAAVRSLFSGATEDYGRQNFWIELFEHAANDVLLQCVTASIAHGYNLDDERPSTISNNHMLSLAKQGKVRISLDYEVVGKPDETSSS